MLGCLAFVALAACVWHFLPHLLALVVSRRERT